jgi:hypothetical protein
MKSLTDIFFQKSYFLHPFSERKEVYKNIFPRASLWFSLIALEIGFHLGYIFFSLADYSNLPKTSEYNIFQPYKKPKLMRQSRFKSWICSAHVKPYNKYSNNAKYSIHPIHQ